MYQDRTEEGEVIPRQLQELQDPCHNENEMCDGGCTQISMGFVYVYTPPLCMLAAACAPLSSSGCQFVQAHALALHNVTCVLSISPLLTDLQLCLRSPCLPSFFHTQLQSGPSLEVNAWVHGMPPGPSLRAACFVHDFCPACLALGKLPCS